MMDGDQDKSENEKDYFIRGLVICAALLIFGIAASITLEYVM